MQLQTVLRYSYAYDMVLGAFAKLRTAAFSFVISVRPSTWNNWAATGKPPGISRKYVEKIQV
jgi:hypothetical protein